MAILQKAIMFHVKHRKELIEMLTKTGITELLKSVMSNGEITPENETLMSSIMKDFEEKEQVLKKYGSFPDDETLTDFEFKENEVQDNGDEWKKKYAELREQYVNRFFNGEGSKEDIISDHKEDMKNEEEEKTIVELFTEREGDK